MTLNTILRMNGEMVWYGPLGCAQGIPSPMAVLLAQKQLCELVLYSNDVQLAYPDKFPEAQ
jgi:hypothetical protein